MMRLVCLCCAWPWLVYVFQLTLSMQTRLIGSVIKKIVIPDSVPQPHNGHVPLVRSHVHHLEDAQLGVKPGS